MKRKFLALLITVTFLLTGCSSTTETSTTESGETSTQASEQASDSANDIPDSIGNIDVHYSDSVRNDSTGKWRISLVATSEEIQNFALDYYKSFFKSDEEIHAVVNFTPNTTSNITVIGNLLDVTVHEYVDGEEHDANELFSGAIISEYQINIETGEIEQIQ